VCQIRGSDIQVYGRDVCRRDVGEAVNRYAKRRAHIARQREPVEDSERGPPLTAPKPLGQAPQD
jgi:hypothetical protein